MSTLESTQMQEVQKKGIDRCWMETSLDPKQLHLHITEIPPGKDGFPSAPHPPHTHTGAEAFYILEGSGLINTETGSIPVSANHAVILDASRQHGLVNTGSVPMKYVVIIANA